MRWLDFGGVVSCKVSESKAVVGGAGVSNKAVQLRVEALQAEVRLV
jgi:hypothetical protein